MVDFKPSVRELWTTVYGSSLYELQCLEHHLNLKSYLKHGIFESLDEQHEVEHVLGYELWYDWQYGVWGVREGEWYGGEPCWSPAGTEVVKVRGGGPHETPYTARVAAVQSWQPSHTGTHSYLQVKIRSKQQILKWLLSHTKIILRCI